MTKQLACVYDTMIPVRIYKTPSVKCPVYVEYSDTNKDIYINWLNGDWVNVTYDGFTGYVKIKHLNLGGGGGC